MNKKANAYMEFLMTYGWAILVVLIAIGALAYFGVLNPANFLPDNCNCGYVNMYLSNGVVEKNITYIECYEVEKFLNNEKTRIDLQITYTLFYCDDDLKQLIEIQ